MTTKKGPKSLSDLVSPQAKRSIVGFISQDSQRAILSVRAEMAELMMAESPDWEKFRLLSERLVGLCVATGTELGSEVKGLLFLATQRGWREDAQSRTGKGGRTIDGGDIPAKVRVLEKKLRLAE